LQRRYTHRSRAAILNALRSHRGATMSYDEVYGNAMAYPLVTQSDLNTILQSLSPDVQLKLAGTRRKKPMLFKGDYVILR
jgi:hypothetical protein